MINIFKEFKTCLRICQKSGNNQKIPDENGIVRRKKTKPQWMNYLQIRKENKWPGRWVQRKYSDSRLERLKNKENSVRYDLNI